MLAFLVTRWRVPDALSVAQWDCGRCLCDGEQHSQNQQLTANYCNTWDVQIEHSSRAFMFTRHKGYRGPRAKLYFLSMNPQLSSCSVTHPRGTRARVLLSSVLGRMRRTTNLAAAPSIPWSCTIIR